MLTKFRRNKKDKKNIKNFLSIVFFVSLGAGVLLIMTLLIIGNIRINEKRDELNARVNFLKKQIQELQEKEELLKSQILEVQGDEWLEGKARDLFNLKKEGEKVRIIEEKD
jgi:cell division protein FtsB